MYKKTLLVLLTIFIFISSIALDNKAFAAEPSVTPTEPEGIAAEANKRIAVNIIGTCLRSKNPKLIYFIYEHSGIQWNYS